MQQSGKTVSDADAWCGPRCYLRGSVGPYLNINLVKGAENLAGLNLVTAVVTISKINSVFQMKRI